MGAYRVAPPAQIEEETAIMMNNCCPFRYVNFIEEDAVPSRLCHYVKG